MRRFLTPFYVLILLLLVPVAAEAQSSQRTTKAESGFGAIIKDLATTWWLWLGILVILGLVGYLLYLRNKSDD